MMCRISPLALLIACTVVIGGEDAIAQLVDPIEGIDLPPVETPPVEPPEGGGGGGDPTDNLPPITLPTPRIVVLVHGMLTSGSDRHMTARSYWSFEFVRGILGADTGALVTLDGTTITDHDQWRGDGATLGAIDEDSAAHAFVTRPTLIGPAGQPPAYTVALSARDASIGLREQAAFAARQIDMLLHQFKAMYADYLEACDCEPQLILVGHSMGGLVIRTILSNPRPDVPCSAINPSCIPGQRTTHEAMDFIRDRTLFAVTLATPHDGTVFADRGQALITYLEALPQRLDAVTNHEPVVATVVPVTTILDRLEIASGTTKADFADDVTDYIVRLNDARGAIEDLTTTYLTTANATFLSPSAARRTAAADTYLGPGTGGRLVPIYTFGGRSPGSIHFTTPFLHDAIARMAREREADRSNILLKIAIDLWMATYPDGFGSAASFGPFADAIDRVERSSWEDEIEEWLAALDATLATAHALAIALRGYDLTSWMASALDVIPDVILPVYFFEDWDVDLSTSSSLSSAAFSCGGVTILASEVTGLPSALLALANADANTLSGLVTSGASFPTVLTTLASSGTLNAAAVNALGASFGAAIGSVVNCGAPSRWAFVLARETFPTPRLVATGGAVSDGEIDSDGAVPYDSAMGLDLAGAATFGACDAWQRRFDSPFEAEYHEGLNVRGHLGRYLFDELVSQAGAEVCP